MFDHIRGRRAPAIAAAVALTATLASPSFASGYTTIKLDESNAVTTGDARMAGAPVGGPAGAGSAELRSAAGEPASLRATFSQLTGTPVTAISDLWYSSFVDPDSADATQTAGIGFVATLVNSAGSRDATVRFSPTLAGETLSPSVWMHHDANAAGWWAEDSSLSDCSKSDPCDLATVMADLDAAGSLSATLSELEIHLGHGLISASTQTYADGVWMTLGGSRYLADLGHSNAGQHTYMRVTSHYNDRGGDDCCSLGPSSQRWTESSRGPLPGTRFTQRPRPNSVAGDFTGPGTGALFVTDDGSVSPNYALGDNDRYVGRALTDLVDIVYEPFRRSTSDNTEVPTIRVEATDPGTLNSVFLRFQPPAIPDDVLMRVPAIREVDQRDLRAWKVSQAISGLDSSSVYTWSEIGQALPDAVIGKVGLIVGPGAFGYFSGGVDKIDFVFRDGSTHRHDFVGGQWKPWPDGDVPPPTTTTTTSPMQATKTSLDEPRGSLVSAAPGQVGVKHLHELSARVTLADGTPLSHPVEVEFWEDKDSDTSNGHRRLYCTVMTDADGYARCAPDQWTHLSTQPLPTYIVAGFRGTDSLLYSFESRPVSWETLTTE